MHDCLHAKLFSHVHLFETLWTVAYKAPLSIGFSRQEYWSGLPYPPLRHLNSGIAPTSLKHSFTGRVAIPSSKAS